MLRAPTEPVYDSMASDGAGNLTHDGSHDDGWNPFNELERVTSAGGTTTFVRDATGRVSGIRSTRSHSPERRLLWEGTDVVLELDAANQPLRLLESGGFRDFVRQADYFYVRDARGSVIGLMDNTGTLLKRWSYDAWGVRRVVWAHPEHKSLESPIGFCGYYHHPETGLYLTPTRAYSPALRRWLSRDPIGYAGGDTNLFAYVGGDPVNDVDPTGASPALYAIGIAGAVGVALGAWYAPEGHRIAGGIRGGFAGVTGAIVFVSVSNYAGPEACAISAEASLRLIMSNSFAGSLGGAVTAAIAESTDKVCGQRYGLDGQFNRRELVIAAVVGAVTGPMAAVEFRPGIDRLGMAVASAASEIFNYAISGSISLWREIRQGF